MSCLAWFVQQWKRIDLNRIDETSTLLHIDRDAYKYQEGDHALIVQIELQVSEPEVIVYADTIKAWLPPHENEPLPTEEKQRLLQQVCKGLKKKRISYEIW